jgi:arylsulfatase A-like enzyme
MTQVAPVPAPSSRPGTNKPVNRDVRARPNIVLVLCDDLGFSDVGPFGSEIPTPHLDALAASGVRMTQMYNAARCCPSRASLLTGTYPTQADVGHMTETGAFFDQDGYRGRLGERVVTFAEALGAAGYRTAMVGKWHVGGPLGADAYGFDAERHSLPWDRGFERFFGTLLGAGSYFSPEGLLDGTRPYEVDDGFYYTDAIADRACAAVDDLAPGADPFVLYVAHTAPHWPLHAPEEDVEPHLGAYLGGWDRVRAERHERARSLGVVDPAWGIATRDEQVPEWAGSEHQAWEDRRMAVYAAQVTAIDRSVGRIVERLTAHEVRDDTLLVFLSDNGGCAELLKEEGQNPERRRSIARDGAPVAVGNRTDVAPGDEHTFQSYGRAWAQVSNAPFRRYKRWVHEGGIATPFVASWPAALPAGGVVHEPGHVVDVLATFLDAAGAPYPTERDGVAVHPLEGRSLLALLRGEASDGRRELCWEHEGNRAIRSGDLKLVAVQGGPWELYRMDLDRTERDDLADRYPRDVERLGARWERWADRTGVVPWPELLARAAANAGATEGSA